MEQLLSVQNALFVYGLKLCLNEEENRILDIFFNLLHANSVSLQNLLQQKDTSCQTWLITLDELDNRIGEVWFPLQYLQSVLQLPSLQEAYSRGLEKLSEYALMIGQNKNLYMKMQNFLQNEAVSLTSEQKIILEKNVLAFHLSGVDFSPNEQELFFQYQQKLSELMQSYDTISAQANYGWFKEIKDTKEQLDLPNMVTLDEACYSAVMCHARSRALREEVYTAYLAQPFALAKDNDYLLADILITRNKLANLFKYKSYFEYTLQSRTLKKSSTIINFLYGLRSHCQGQAAFEAQEIKEFARQQDHITHLQPWDITYYGNQLRQQWLGISEKELREYFPLNQVLSGLFDLTHRLFGVTFKAISEENVWHPSVQCLVLEDRCQQEIGILYLDLYSRPHKLDTAWTTSLRTRYLRADGSYALPAVVITANFSPPCDRMSSLLSLEEIRVLFHEFGHALHHLLSKVNHAAISGINGLPLDIIEVPSFFLEKWSFHPVVVSNIAKHYKTQAPLPKSIVDSLWKTQHFPAALQLLDRIVLAIFDLRLHGEVPNSSVPDPQKILEEVCQETGVGLFISRDYIQRRLPLIFTQGYAAGYYSYIWSEVIASDLFAEFEKNGGFHPSTCQRFTQNVWQNTGACDFNQLLLPFLRRPIDISHLLRQRGINNTEEVIS